MSDRIGGVLRRRPALLAACALPPIILLVAYMQSTRGLEQQARELQRENLALRLSQLASAVDRESAELGSAAQLLAQSDSIVELVQENRFDSRSSALGAALPTVDALVVATAVGAVRLSGAVLDGRLTERAPDPAVAQYLNALLAGRATSASPSDREPPAALINDQLVSTRRIFARGSSVPVGWLIATRNLNRAMLARLESSVGGALIARPIAKLDRGTVPAEVRTWLGGRLGEASGLSTKVLPDGSAFAALRDESGHAAWVFQVRAATAVGAPASDASFAQALPANGALAPALAGFVALLAALVAASVVIVLKRYYGHRLAVDSRYKAIIDQTNDGIVIVDSKRHEIQYCNPAFLERIGYTKSEAQGLTLPDIFADANAPPEGVLARLSSADSHMALNLQLRCKNGALIDVEVRCNRLESDGREGLAYVTHDVSVRRKAEQQLIDNQQRLDRMAHHDQLTGLPNRHYLATFLPQAILEARAASTMLGVVFLDLDRFKHINDTRGHETGDKLLQEVAGRLRTCVRDSDVVIRMGGDEFVVVFRNVKSYDEVTLGANRIIESLNMPIVIDQHPLQTTGSVGVSLYPRDGADMGELLKHSDTAMYQAKDRGRNNVQMFSQIMNRKLKHRVAMEASLRDALRLKQLDVHYQPFVNLLTRKVVGLEALIRWRHPVHGMIPADQFIPVAEETGLIVPMGNFVLHRTLQTMSAWQKAGVKVVPISLNVAPAQLLRGELQSTISTLLKTHGLRPELLQLEMTERAVFDSTQAKAGENRQDTMMRLRDLGIKIAIDDFGTGYSSLSYLKNWRVDALKIDRSFVRDLVTDSSDLAIVSAIIAIAKHLHIQVIAEGIEGYQQAEILRKLGCTVGQGFLFARPMPPDQCLALLENNAVGAGEEEDMLAVFASGRA
jgi:diguanylate cyclase (GGDEF)-like protein/PAS domain S-box-containing protein